MVARYKKNSSPTSSLESRGDEAMNFFSSWKANQHWSIHMKPCILHRILKKGRQCLANLDMNKLRVATWLISYWTSFLEIGCCISKIYWVFFGFALIRCSMTMKPRNLLVKMLNVHFLGFSFIWWQQRLLKASCKLVMWSTFLAFLTSMSST